MQTECTSPPAGPRTSCVALQLHQAGPWAMAERMLGGYFHLAGRLTVNVDLPAEARGQGARGSSSLTVRDGIAIVGISGMMVKGDSPWWWASTSTVLTRRKLRDALQRQDVAGILLIIESVGGQLGGTMELADEIAATAKQKPVWAFAEDVCTSAAYWVGCQAEKVYANAMAHVGGIGIYTTILDSSGAAEKAGIKVHVIKAGEYKAAGTPGTKITDKQLGEWQGQINQLNEHFVAAVARGRKVPLDRARQLSDGREYIGSKAKAMGLIDGVQSLDTTWSQFLTHIRSKQS